MSQSIEVMITIEGSRPDVETYSPQCGYASHYTNGDRHVLSVQCNNLYISGLGAGDQEKLCREAKQCIEHRVYPGLQHLAKFISNQYMPKCRTG